MALVPHDISWDEYNAAQWGREPRASLAAALDAVGRSGTASRATVPGPPGPVDGSAAPRRARVAVDIGCGEGVEVSALLADGWVVHAVDGEAAALQRLAGRTPDHLRDRLHIHQVDYAAIDVLPDADLVHASYSLPYCPPGTFPRLWAAVRGAMRPGAVLSCQLFGPNDESFGDPEMTFHAAEDVRGLLAGLEVIEQREEDADGQSYTGPKHWHVFHVLARRPGP